MAKTMSYAGATAGSAPSGKRGTVKNASMYSVHGITAEQLHFGKPKRVSACCLVWWIILFILWLAILVTALYAAGSLVFRHSYSAEVSFNDWTFDELATGATTLAAPFDEYTVNVDFKAFFGDLRIRDDPRGTEFPTLRRVDLANRMPERLQHTVKPNIVVDNTAKTILIEIRSFTFLDFIVGAGRRSEHILTLPISTHIGNIDVNVGNGVFTFDADTVTVENLNFDVKLDLISYLGSVSLINGTIGRVAGRTGKPHLCVGDVSTDSCQSVRVQGDLHLRGGMHIGEMAFSSVAGNVYTSGLEHSAVGTTHYEGWVPKAGTGATNTVKNEWSFKTFNGLLHVYTPAPPYNINADVTFTTWQFSKVKTVQVLSKSPAFDGYTIHGTIFTPESAVSGKCVGGSCTGDKNVRVSAGFGELAVGYRI